MKKTIILLLCFILLNVSISCDNPDLYEIPDNYYNDTVVSLNTKVETIQDAAAAASDYINEWARAAKLSRVEVVFTGDQIKSQRGVIKYFYVADDGKAKCFAEATVTVDMQTSSIIILDAWYDARTLSKRIKNGDFEGWYALDSVDMSEWTLTLDEAFNIVYSEIGKDAFSRFEKLKVTLTCFSNEWTFYVTKETETYNSVLVKNIISINPITKEITYIKGFSDITL